MADETNIQRVLIWSSWLRLSHWLMAIAVLLLAATGWLIKMTPSVANAASDYHYLLAIPLTIGLGLRAWLLLADKGVGHWSRLVPEARERRAYKPLILFYVSFGRMPLPKWYAQNPLWKPVYIVILFVLLLQILTGMNSVEHPVVLGFYLPQLHDIFASIILAFTAAHIIAVVLHDYKGTASDISAMVHGHRIFVVDKPESQEQQAEQPIIFKPYKK